MKKIILLFIVLTLTLRGFNQPKALKSLILQNAGYSVCVINAENGQVVFENKQVSLVPASVMKVVTTAAALSILGPEYIFHTKIGYTGRLDSINGQLKGDLVLKGGGDPAFYSEYFPEHYRGTFEDWADAILQKGIKSVSGDLIIDLSHFGETSVPGGWVWEDIGNYYGAGVSGLTYSDNQYKIHFSTPNIAGKPAVIDYLSPVTDSLRLINNVLSSDNNKDESIVYGAPGSFSQLIEGTIPKGRSDFIVKAAMPDPARCAAKAFINVLILKSIKFSGKIRIEVNSKYGGYVEVADKPSPLLQDIIIPLNHESINLFAEHLLREISFVRSSNSNLKGSAEVLKEFWSENKIFTDGFYPADGSGLSRSNGVCPKTLAEILRYIYLSKNRDVFFNSLPVAGLTGTLSGSFKGSKLEGNLKAKTGSMTRVRSLAGLFENHNGEKMIFAIITNNFEGTQSMIGHTIVDLLSELYYFDPPKKKEAISKVKNLTAECSGVVKLQPQNR